MLLHSYCFSWIFKHSFNYETNWHLFGTPEIEFSRKLTFILSPSIDKLAICPSSGFYFFLLLPFFFLWITREMNQDWQFVDDITNQPALGMLLQVSFCSRVEYIFSFSCSCLSLLVTLSLSPPQDFAQLQGSNLYSEQSTPAGI